MTNLILWIGISLAVFGTAAYAVAPAIYKRNADEPVEATAERAGDRLERLTGGVVSITRVVIVTFASLAIMIATEGLSLLTELGGFAGDAPLVSSNVLAIAGIGAVVADLGISIDVLATIVLAGFAVALYARYG